MRINFTKMQGLGNDFVVVSTFDQPLSLSVDNIRFIADRRLGIGCDQVLLASPTTLEGVDFSYRIFNADGGEVGQCGNGARCFFKFVRDRGLTEKKIIKVQTLEGILQLFEADDNQITVDMGIPRFDPGAIPFVADREAPVYAIKAGDKNLEISIASIGNPHAVIQVDNIEGADVLQLGALIENHERFPNHTNVGFMQVINDSRISLRVFERGVGETMACGSGACAAAVVGKRLGLLKSNVIVKLPGGELKIYWQNENSSIMMTGPAETVFEGSICL